MFTTRPERAGLSVLEVLVSSLIFSGLLMTLLVIERMNAQSLRQTEANSDTYHLAMLALDRIKVELRGARVVSVEEQVVEFQLPQLDAAGNLLDDGNGLPIWTPELPERDSLGLAAEGVVFLQRGGKVTRCARLGQRGKLSFTLPSVTGYDLLEVKVHAEPVSSDPRVKIIPYDASLTLYFPTRI